MALSANRSTHVTIAGKEFLYFGGANYLGLAHRREIQKAAETAFSKFGFSSGASRLTSGENESLLSLEDELAALASVEKTLVLPAGFLTNQAVAEGLSSDVDVWVIQSNAHASVQSAVRHSGKHVIVHDFERSQDDPPSIRRRFNISADRSIGIFVEEVDPLSGKLFDIRRVLDQAGKRDYVVIDEAHSFAVLGDNGLGVFEFYGIAPAENVIRTGTFSKAVGTYGGFILASARIIASIKEQSLCYKGSTSLPPLICAATSASLRVIQDDRENTIGKLKNNILLLNDMLKEIGVQAQNSDSVPIYYLRDLDEVHQIRTELPKQGISIPEMGAYFAGQGNLGLRWTIQAGHTKHDFEQLVGVISRVEHQRTK